VHEDYKVKWALRALLAVLDYLVVWVLAALLVVLALMGYLVCQVHQAPRAYPDLRDYKDRKGQLEQRVPLAQQAP
jgi:hypothetical protein